MWFLNFGQPAQPTSGQNPVKMTGLIASLEEIELCQADAFKRNKDFFKIMLSCESISAKVLVWIPETATQSYFTKNLFWQPLQNYWRVYQK